MSKIGIMSILPKIEAERYSSFDHLYQSVGRNTGNLLFTNAVWGQIVGEKERISYSFDPDFLNESLDALVIPAANWLNAQMDLSKFADAVERLKIPVVLIGLGAQDVDYSGKVDIPSGTVRFVRAVAERSNSLSVRGNYTKEVLAGFGIFNVTVTGCPSLYRDFRTFSVPRQPDRNHMSRGLIHSTRYSARFASYAEKESVHRRLFRFAFAEQFDLLLQSEREEMAHLVRHLDASEIDGQVKSNLLKIYNTEDWDALVKYWAEHARLFFDVDEWSSALEAYDFVLGSRLHGTIMALNSGVPAILIQHDSRTREMAEFAAIPTIRGASMELNIDHIYDWFESIDLKEYYTRRELNGTTYVNFLKNNGLEVNRPGFAGGSFS